MSFFQIEMVTVAMLAAGAVVTIHTQMLDVTIVQVRVLGTAVAGGLAALVLTLDFLREMRECGGGFSRSVLYTVPR